MLYRNREYRPQMSALFREIFLCSLCDDEADAFTRLGEVLAERLQLNRADYERTHTEHSFILAQMHAVLADLHSVEDFLGEGLDQAPAGPMERQLLEVAERLRPKLAALADELEDSIVQLTRG